MAGARPFTLGPPNRAAALPPALADAALAARLAGTLLPVDAGHYVATGGHRMERGADHDDLLLILVTGGRGRWRLDGAGGEAGPGTLVVLPAGRGHAYAADRDDPWTIWWCHWRGRELPRLAGEHPALAPGAHPCGPEAGGAAVAAAWNAVIEALAAAQDRAGALRAACAGWHLLGQLAAAGDQARLHADARVLAILAAIRQHPERALGLAAAARLAGCSPGHAQALFRAATGQPIAAYQQALRLRRAAALLDSTAEDIAAIAARVGYADPFLFSRRFRAAYGCAPSAWRRRRLT